MKKRHFEIYQYLAPAILTPLSFALWWQSYAGDIALTLMAWLIPVLYAYIVPGVGTNVLKVWEFDTRLRLGRFRPHHGFVFGSATATLAWLCHGSPAQNGWDILRLSFVFASVLGFWNVLYDIKAIQSGLLKVYNQPWADEQGAEAITLDYAPWFFAGFGAMYGAGLGLAEYLNHKGLLANWQAGALLVLTLVCSIALPVYGYRQQSMRRHGHHGCSPVARKQP